MSSSRIKTEVEYWSRSRVYRVWPLQGRRIKELEVHFEWRGWQQCEGKVKVQVKVKVRLRSISFKVKVQVKVRARLRLRLRLR